MFTRLDGTQPSMNVPMIRNEVTIAIWLCCLLGLQKHAHEIYCNFSRSSFEQLNNFWRFGEHKQNTFRELRQKIRDLGGSEHYFQRDREQGPGGGGSSGTPRLKIQRATNFQSIQHFTIPPHVKNHILYVDKMFCYTCNFRFVSCCSWCYHVEI